jgi:hypothetical protein
MDRDFRTGRIEIDFPAEPFASAPTLLARSAVVFFSNLPLLAAITLVVYLPAKLAIQFACYVLDVPTSGILSYIFLEVSDLVLGALAVPAAIYGLVERFRGRRAPMAECLRWGRRAWARMLWNQFKVDITITLWGALLIVPGILAMVRLIFVEPVVAIEGDSAADPLERSRGLTRGRRWRIFFRDRTARHWRAGREFPGVALAGGRHALARIAGCRRQPALRRGAMDHGRGTADVFGDGREAGAGGRQGAKDDCAETPAITRPAKQPPCRGIDCRSEVRR